jgi:hypothetical protein
MPDFIALTCPACGGQLQVAPAENQVKCNYCKTEFLLNNKVAERKTTALNALVFKHQSEPREGAFSLQVPEGWLTEGGIFRANPMQTMLNAQAIEAKLDFIVKRDALGSVALRWCPEVKYTDPGMNMGAMLSGFMGGNYSGMLVSPLLSPIDFILRVVFPWAHPQAANVQIVHQQELPLLVDNYRKRMTALGLPAMFAYQGGMVVFTYTEGSITFRENIFTVIESMGAAAAGMWSNKDTFIERALAAEFDQWQPIMAHIRDSGQLNPNWLMRELQNQGILAGNFLDAQRQQQAREQQMLNTQRDLQNMDRQIEADHQQAHAEIQNDQYLNLMNLEEYVNPYTHLPETGSNQWNYRWVTESGDEFYCDDLDKDPNRGSVANRSDWKLTPVRKRSG